MDTATPWAGGKPARPQISAAAPSRTPQPATDSGINIARSTGGVSANSVPTPSSTPIDLAAQVNTSA
ncbi:hypothetical protein GCM10017767_07360 [Halomonas urumqiensis]|nr:hypothetical protein GCM10017767_07360 [Halomonas urumqiensis]